MTTRVTGSPSFDANTRFAEQVVDALPAPATSAVLGSCTGAMVAVELAAQLRRRSAEPGPVVVVNPQRVVSAYLLEKHRAIAARPSVNETAPPDPDPLGAEPFEPVELHADLLQRAERFGIAQGGPAEDAEICAADLCDRYRAWFGFPAMNARPWAA